MFQKSSTKSSIPAAPIPPALPDEPSTGAAVIQATSSGPPTPSDTRDTPATPPSPFTPPVGQVPWIEVLDNVIRTRDYTDRKSGEIKVLRYQSVDLHLPGKRNAIDYDVLVDSRSTLGMQPGRYRMCLESSIMLGRFNAMQLGRVNWIPA